MAENCVFCDKLVRFRQQAVSCDVCTKWQHRTCNTGISVTQYRAAVRDGTTLQFTCYLCKNAVPEPMDVTQSDQDADMTVSYSEIPDTSSHLPLRVPSIDEPLTSTRLSAADSIIVRSDETMTNDDSDFDVTRPDREMPEEIQETTLADETVNNAPNQAPVTYEVVEGGSERGYRKVVSSNGYAFVKKRTLANGTIDWRCSVRSKGSGCPATIKQFQNTFRVVGGSHNHQAKPGLVTAIKVKKELDEEFLQELGEDFYRVTVPAKERRHVIFATNYQLELLQKAKTWYVDGTFKVVKHPFVQLLSIHAFVKSDDSMKQMPLCYVLMSGKSKKDYKKVFPAVLRLLPTTHVQSFVADFEAGIWQGLRSVFEEPEIKGCAFHFGQALFRKVRDSGLQTAYTERDAVYRLLRKTFALPLLPAEDIPAAFNKLREKSNDERLNAFFEYVQSTWINNDLWPVASWSVFGRAIRTNNDVEGWHARLNRRAYKGNLPFYLLVDLLFRESKDIPIQVKLVRENKLRRHQKKASLTTQGKLMTLWTEYSRNERSTRSLLDACASMYGPV